MLVRKLSFRRSNHGSNHEQKSVTDELPSEDFKSTGRSSNGECFRADEQEDGHELKRQFGPIKALSARLLNILSIDPNDPEGAVWHTSDQNQGSRSSSAVNPDCATTGNLGPSHQIASSKLKTDTIESENVTKSLQKRQPIRKEDLETPCNRPKVAREAANAVTTRKVPSETFANILTSRNFDAMITIMRDNSFQSSDLIRWMTEETPLFQYRLPLHTILPYQPTLEIVDLVSKKLFETMKTEVEWRRTIALDFDVALLTTDPEDTIDQLGQVPLHVAALNGCDVSVIRRLLTASSQSRTTAMCRDYFQRYPLHCACSNVKGYMNFSDGFPTSSHHSSTSSGKKGGGWGISIPSFSSHSAQSNKCREKNMIRVIETLVHAYPAAVMARDLEGKRPIDLARQNKADPAILQMLQDCAREQRRLEISSYDAPVLNNYANASHLKMHLPHNKIHDSFVNHHEYFERVDLHHRYNLSNNLANYAPDDRRIVVPFDVTLDINFEDSVSTLGSDGNGSIQSKPKAKSSNSDPTTEPANQNAKNAKTKAKKFQQQQLEQINSNPQKTVSSPVENASILKPIPGTEKRRRPRRQASHSAQQESSTVSVSTETQSVQTDYCTHIISPNLIEC